jgi:hypothetical protein
MDGDRVLVEASDRGLEAKATVPRPSNSIHITFAKSLKHETWPSRLKCLLGPGNTLLNTYVMLCYAIERVRRHMRRSPQVTFMSCNTPPESLPGLS